MPPIRFSKPSVQLVRPRLPRKAVPSRAPSVADVTRATTAALAQRAAGSPAAAPRPARPMPDYSRVQMRPNPYVDYARRYTAEGGIAITYKDVDEGLWVTIRRMLMWLAAMGAAALYVLCLSPMDALGNGVALVAMAIVSGMIVAKPLERYRQIEVRPDCMIIDGADVFWRDNMELEWPSFRPAPDGRFVLAGVYGTRWIEYFTVRRFDEHDRAPEVFAAHLQAAMQQQWANLGRQAGG